MSMPNPGSTKSPGTERVRNSIERRRHYRMGVSASELRRRAEKDWRYKATIATRRILCLPTNRYTAPSGRRFAGPAAVVLGVLLLLAGVPTAFYMFGRPHTDASTVVAPPPQPRPWAGPARLELQAPPGVSARDELRALAAKAEASPKLLISTYSYVHTQTWSADDSIVGGAPVLATDNQSWVAADRSGVSRKTPLPPQDPGERSAAWISGLPAATKPETQSYAVGRFPQVIPRPSTDRALLAGQLLAYERGNLMQALADLNRDHCLDPLQRSAALHVLADNGNVTYHGRMTDRAKRSGIAVTSSNDDGTTDLLVFDEETGSLLSYERIVATGPATSTQRPVVFSYVLYLDCRYVDDSRSGG